MLRPADIDRCFQSSVAPPFPEWIAAQDALIVVDRQSDLFEIVLALAAAGGRAGLLNGRQKEGHQDRNNGDHHQQLDQRKSGSQTFHDGSSWKIRIETKKRMNCKSA